MRTLVGFAAGFLLVLLATSCGEQITNVYLGENDGGNGPDTEDEGNGPDTEDEGNGPDTGAPSMSVISPTPNQVFNDCEGHSFAVCVPVEIDLRNVTLVPKWGQDNVEGEGHLYVTVAPTGEPEAAIPITAVDQGVVERNFTIDISALPDGDWTLRVEVRNNNRSQHAQISPVSIDFAKEGD